MQANSAIVLQMIEGNRDVEDEDHIECGAEEQTEACTRNLRQYHTRKMSYMNSRPLLNVQARLICMPNREASESIRDRTLLHTLL